MKVYMPCRVDNQPISKMVKIKTNMTAAESFEIQLIVLFLRLYGDTTLLTLVFKSSNHKFNIRHRHEEWTAIPFCIKNAKSNCLAS